MEDYLFDRETLGKFVDELIKKRPLPIEDANELNSFREEQIRALDNHITNELFGSLSEEQITNLNQLLDQESENPDVFRNFFSEHGITVEQLITDAANTFSTNYLKGAQNAWYGIYQ